MSLGETAPGEVAETIFFAKIVRRSEYPRLRDRERPESGLCGDGGDSAERGERGDIVLCSGDLTDKRSSRVMLVSIVKPLELLLL